jgi:hypothetical protein
MMGQGKAVKEVSDVAAAFSRLDTMHGHDKMKTGRVEVFGTGNKNRASLGKSGFDE